MEQVLRMLRSLTGAAGAFGNIPKPIKVSLTTFGGIVAIWVILSYGLPKLTHFERIFFGIAIVLLILITAGYYVWKWYVDKGKSVDFGGLIKGGSTVVPKDIRAVSQRARLDDLRKRFQTGIDAYRSRGKDLYKLPWYLIVGEPGSGKTEAIRHSNVGFPAGMQDEFQGVGGTINMNWWFTNHAVMLDTAGRLVFDDVKPGEIGEWEEFLALLKKARSNCPINGLLLVIPSDTLLTDSEDQIKAKAGKIAKQLEVIQTTLDVRFPVFVVITKCDKLIGFREFFDGVTDPQLQHQMLGWSNQDPLDDPFRPELVEAHLAKVTAQLQRRRLGLLRDPVPENDEGRRADEVDALFAFPKSFELLGNRLRRYLESIFVVSEWSSKPLFLRGIYFSSSMREGSALDAELAEAFGVAVKDLPEGRLWERDRSYFLRDLFLEKAFREKGLVTRASNTRLLLRGQLIALYGFGFVSLCVLLLFAWFMKGNLQQEVKDQSDYWQAVSNAGWNGNYWKHSLVPYGDNGKFEFRIATNQISVDNQPKSIGEFHLKLIEMANRPLKTNRFLPGLATTYNQNSHRAQRLVFEAGVVRPLLDATRQKLEQNNRVLLDPNHEPEILSDEREILGALIQLESDILSRTNSRLLSEKMAKEFLTPFANYLEGSEVNLDTNLIAAMVWTYSTNSTSQGAWPMRWLSGSGTNPPALENNLGVRCGLELFLGNTTRLMSVLRSNAARFEALKAHVDNFSVVEDQFWSSVTRGEQRSKLAELDGQAARLQQVLLQSRAYYGIGSGSGLTNAYFAFRNQVQGSDARLFSGLRRVADAAASLHKTVKLFEQVKRALDSGQTQSESEVANLLSKTTVDQFRSIQLNYLDNDVFLSRVKLYQKAQAMIDGNAQPFRGVALRGNGGRELSEFLEEQNGLIRREATNFQGVLSGRLVEAVNGQLRQVREKYAKDYFQEYLTQQISGTTQFLRFPLVKVSGAPLSLAQLQDARRVFQAISADLHTPPFTDFQPWKMPAWATFTNHISKRLSTLGALLDKDGQLSRCVISLVKAPDEKSPKELWRDSFRNVLFKHGTTNSEIFPTLVSKSDIKLGEASLDGSFAIEWIKNINSSKVPHSTNHINKWDLLNLIYDPRYQAVSSPGRKEWTVEIPAPQTWDAEKFKGTKIPLKLHFERPIPELED